MLNDDFLKAIGTITVNFKKLEDYISNAITILVTPDQKMQEMGDIITAELSFRNKLNLLDSLFRYRVSKLKDGNPEWIDEMSDLISQASRLEEERNLITHSSWKAFAGASSDSAQRIKLTAKRNKGLKDNKKEVTLKELNKIAAAITDLACKFQHLIVRRLKISWRMTVDSKQ